MGWQGATLTPSRPPTSNRIDTMKLKAIALTTMLSTAMTVAQATPLSYSSNILPDQSTNWSNYLDLQQFDPALGTLQSMFPTLQGDVIAMVLELNVSSGMARVVPCRSQHLYLFLV